MNADVVVKPLPPNVWALLKIVVRYSDPTVSDGGVEVDTFRHHFGSMKPLVEHLTKLGLVSHYERPGRRGSRADEFLKPTRAGQLWYDWQKE